MCERDYSQLLLCFAYYLWSVGNALFLLCFAYFLWLITMCSIGFDSLYIFSALRHSFQCSHRLSIWCFLYFSCWVSGYGLLLSDLYLVIPAALKHLLGLLEREEARSWRQWRKRGPKPSLTSGQKTQVARLKMVKGRPNFVLQKDAQEATLWAKKIRFLGTKQKSQQEDLKDSFIIFKIGRWKSGAEVAGVYFWKLLLLPKNRLQIEHEWDCWTESFKAKGAALTSPRRGSDGGNKDECAKTGLNLCNFYKKLLPMRDLVYLLHHNLFWPSQ